MHNMSAAATALCDRIMCCIRACAKAQRECSSSIMLLLLAASATVCNSADRSARSYSASAHRLLLSGFVVAGVWLVLQQGRLGWQLGVG
jgi:hypothetical protein